ncbi:MAG: CRTAC1 family protein [Planctomycetota bacterium]|nr:CRTAC1 family protein [Planctomycetota bacterium]
MRWPLLLILPLVFAAPIAAEEEPAPAPAPWFTNVAEAAGLSGVRAKSVVFTDLDGDGFHDLCLDRQRFFLSREDGSRFERHETHGIPYPETRIVPLGRDGKPDEAKAKTRPFVPQYLYFADLDNDGDPDAIYGVKAAWDVFDGSKWNYVEGADHGHRSKVFLNDGKGRFTPAKASAFSAKDAAGPAMALAICDTDGDGRLDLYEGREYRQYGVLYGCGVDRLWRGDGKGGFTDVTEAAGLMTVPEPGTPRSSRPSYGVTHADIDDDGWPDLLQMAYGRQWNYMWRNKGDGTFEEIGAKNGYAGDAITHGRYPDWLKKRMPGRRDEQPFRSNGNTFDCAVGDIDNDGDLDLFLGEIAHFWAGESSDLPALLVNNARGLRFERKTVKDLLPERPFRSESWNYGDLHVAFLDVDNDTRMDILIGSGDYPDGQFLRLYRQKKGGTFEEVTQIAGFDWEGCGGISLGDYDRDGDVDILAGRSFMRLNQKHRDKYMDGISVNEVGLFRNDIANRNGNRWLNVRLVGKGAGTKGGCNKSGIGCRILIEAGGVQQVRELRAGSGLANHQDAPEACFGLGKATQVDRIEVRWAAKDAVPQVFRNVPANMFVTIEQGKPRLRLTRAAN